MHGLGFWAFYKGDLRLVFGAPFLHTFYIQIFHSLLSISDLLFVWRYQLSFQNVKIYLQPLPCAMIDKARITKILITGEQKCFLDEIKRIFHQYLPNLTHLATVNLIYQNQHNEN